LNVCDDAPAGTVTEFGVTRPAGVVVIATLRPPSGAGPLSRSVSDRVLPLVTPIDEAVNPVGPIGFTVRVDVFETPIQLAVIVTGVGVDTIDVEIGNVTVDVSAATVTEAGTDTAGSELLKATTAPPAGAQPASWTVPVSAEPPTTELVDGETLPSWVGRTVIDLV
jgi:hypothetical protein